MRRKPLAGLAAALFLMLAAATTAAARELLTSIDLDYTYTQNNLAGDVSAQTEYNQKYQIVFETSLSSAYDFAGAVRVELQDSWFTNQPGTSRVAPTLELQAKGSQAAVKVSYEGVVTATDAFEELADSTTYSSNLTGTLEMTPLVWPELILRYQRKRDYEAWTADTTTTDVELSLRKDIHALRLEYNIRHEDIDTIVPEFLTSSETQWSGKATYKEIFWGGTEFEFAYEVKEDYKKSLIREVFSSDSEDYTQQLRTRLKNSLAITPRMTLNLGWEYQFDQDLLKLTYDYKVKNQFVLDLRWDFLEWLKLTGEARRDSDLTAAIVGEDDVRSATDTLKAGFDLSRVEWLRIAGKAEFKFDGKVDQRTGASVTQVNEEKYELIAKNRFGNFWDLTVNATSSTIHTDGWISNRETKLKGELLLTYLELIVRPSYEATRTDEWDWGFDVPSSQDQIRDARIRFEYRMNLLDLIVATFTHEYGIKTEYLLDQVLNFERTLTLTEDTKFNLLISEIVRGLRLEGELDRKGSDIEEDADPQLVEVSYALKLDWKLEHLNLSSSFKYNDKGNTFDDLSFNTKVGWKGERLEVSGEYQFDKIYAEQIDEARKLNLKLNYKF